jgi:hypothetical protein
MQCYPWTLVFAGRAIATILLDRFDLDRSGALLAPSSGLITNRTLVLRSGLDTSRWDSIDLISVAVERGLVPRDATRLFDPFKGCNNVEEWPNSLEEWKEVARIAMEVLITLDRKLSGRDSGNSPLSNPFSAS